SLVSPAFLATVSDTGTCAIVVQTRAAIHRTGPKTPGHIPAARVIFNRQIRGSKRAAMDEVIVVSFSRRIGTRTGSPAPQPQKAPLRRPEIQAANGLKSRSGCLDDSQPGLPKCHVLQACMNLGAMARSE